MVESVKSIEKLAENIKFVCDLSRQFLYILTIHFLQLLLLTKILILT